MNRKLSTFETFLQFVGRRKKIALPSEFDCTSYLRAKNLLILSAIWLMCIFVTKKFATNRSSYQKSHRWICSFFHKHQHKFSFSCVFTTNFSIKLFSIIRCVHWICLYKLIIYMIKEILATTLSFEFDKNRTTEI